MPTPSDNLTSVQFKSLPVLNDGKTAKEKRPIYDMTEIVEIRFAANKQTVATFPAHEVAGWVDGPDGTRYQETYAQRYNSQYIAFKDGVGQEQSGTPLAVAPFLDQGKRLELNALNIWTIEALAALDGQPLKRLGMGGRELQKEAAAYLASQPGADNSQLMDLLGEQQRQMAAMQAELDALKNVGKQPDPLDHDEDGKKGGNKAKRQTKAEKEAEAKPSPFAEFDSIDILSWLKDGNADDDFVAKHPIHDDGEGNLSVDLTDEERTALIAHADEVNAKTAKKQAN